MNKTELYKNAKEIVEQEFEDVTIKDTAVFVDAVIKAMTDTLVAGEKIAIAGFGSFEITERAERMGRNPKTNEPILIKSSKTVRFKPAKALKEAVNA